MKLSKRAQVQAKIKSYWIVLLIVLFGCDSDHVRRGEAAPRDAQLIDAPTPLLLVGNNDNRRGHSLHRVAGAVWLPDRDQLIVGDGGSGEVRLFDRDGRYVRSFGKLGQGPGEHDVLAGLWTVANTIATYDMRGRKVLRWSLDGELLREDRLLLSHEALKGGRAPELIAPLDDSSFLAISVIRTPIGNAGEMAVDTAVGFRIQPASGKLTIVFRSPWQTRYAATVPEDGGVIYTPLPMEPSGSAAVADRIFVGYGSDWTVHQYGAASDKLPHLEITKARVPFDNDLRQAWHEEELARPNEGDKAQLRRYLEQFPNPEFMPTYDLIRADSSNIWLRGHPRPGSSEVEWTVIGSDGNLVASILLPRDMVILSTGETHVVALRERPDGAQMVGVYLLSSELRDL